MKFRCHCHFTYKKSRYKKPCLFVYHKIDQKKRQIVDRLRNVIKYTLKEVYLP